MSQTQTFLLPPVSAVRMVLARTGMFSKDEHSKIFAASIETELKRIREQANKNDKEEKYVNIAIATMDATLRSLDIIYKKREFNFKENEKLRKVYSDSIKEDFEFGKKVGDYLKSLPAMAMGGVGGITIASAIASDINLWVIGSAFAISSYIANYIFIKYRCKRTQMLYVAQDYERGLYYDQYVTRVDTILRSLYLDLDRIHKNIFGQSYPVDVDVKNDIIGEMLKGVRPTSCKYVHKHMKEKKIKPGFWALCETGRKSDIEKCPYWED